MLSGIVSCSRYGHPVYQVSSFCSFHSWFKCNNTTHKWRATDCTCETVNFDLFLNAHHFWQSTSSILQKVLIEMCRNFCCGTYHNWA